VNTDAKPRNYFQFLLPCLLATILLAACGGGSDPVVDNTPVTFHFRMRGHPVTEDFLAVISNPETKVLARAQLALPESQRMLHIAGGIGRGNGGYNFNWSWLFESNATLVEMSIELCDTSPSLIETNVDYWVAAAGRACPWAA
jgi:hypothetical protein